MTAMPTIAILIITYRRPQFLHANLEHIAHQKSKPHQVIVVDGSPDNDSFDVARRYDWVTYVRNPRGAGNMTSSRNVGLSSVTSEVIAFLDDDAYPREDYIAKLSAFLVARPDVAIGCCRALNGTPDEHAIGVDAIGRCSERSELSGNFGADPGAHIEIDHGLGATMWIRKSLMDELGGFREYFGGTSAREDTDLFFRARRLGRHAFFVHDAVADHVAAPQADGHRFDRRYTYWTTHNQAVLVAADTGLVSSRFREAFLAEISFHLRYGPVAYRRVLRSIFVVFAWVRGSFDAWMLIGGRPARPIGRFERPSSKNWVFDSFRIRLRSERARLSEVDVNGSAD